MSFLHDDAVRQTDRTDVTRTYDVRTRLRMRVVRRETRLFVAEGEWQRRDARDPGCNLGSR